MSRPNIVLLVLDAVRADHLSCYGHDRQTTPNVDRLAERGVRYEHAFANSNWTGASHAVLFSGYLPSESGVYGDNMVLPENVDLLAELLQNAGYRTFATSAGAHIRGERGYDRGFDSFHEMYRVRPQVEFVHKLLRDTSTLKQLAFSGIRGHDNYALYKFDRLQKWIRSGDDPFFAFVNCKTAHNPYNPPRPYKRAFCEQLERPRYEFVERALERLGRTPQTVPGMDDARLESLSRRFPIIADEFEPTAEELDVLTAWYDGAIRYLDDRIGDFIDFLSRRGELDDTYVIVTADHGELFGEHGLEKHSYSLYEPVLQVPLVVDPPVDSSFGSQTVSEPVTLADLYPTLLEFAGLTPPDRPHADSFADTGRPPSDRHVFAEVGSKSAEPIRRHYPSFDGAEFDGPLQSVRDDRYKLIQGPDGRLELYDWRTDPEERQNLVDEKPAVVERLSSVVEAELQPMSDASFQEDVTDPVLREHLEDLGYL